jgi:hypothetical protein
MNTNKHPLIGDWRARIRDRLLELGFQTVNAFLIEYPGLPYLELSQILGEGIAVPICIVTMQFEEAKAQGNIREAALDALPRAINQYLPTGWQKDGGDTLEENEKKRIDLLTANAYAIWVTQLERCDKGLKPLADAVWRALHTCRPDVGWRPTGPNDLLIKMAFEKGWPE